MHVGIRDELSGHAATGLGLDRGCLADLLLSVGWQDKTHHQSDGCANPWVVHGDSLSIDPGFPGEPRTNVDSRRFPNSLEAQMNGRIALVSDLKLLDQTRWHICRSWLE